MNHCLSVETAKMRSKPRVGSSLGINLEVTCLLSKWSPAQRWHELDLGSYMERGNLGTDVKGAIQMEEP
jgi:hypothetical protein